MSTPALPARRHLAALTTLLLATTAHAAPPAPPQPTPLPPALPSPADHPFPGQITLALDASDIHRHIFRAEETIPVPPGQALILLYPKWLPGNHGPTGPLPNLAGLEFFAGSKPLTWVRDPIDMGAFHIDVPAGTATITARFQYLSPLTPKEGRMVLTANMLDVQWRPEILFPAGYFQRDIQVAASLTLPAGWQFGTALEPAQPATTTSTTQTLHFRPVPLDTLLDSPLYAGRNFSRIDLAPGAKTPIHLDIVADKPEDLAIKPEDLAAHRNLATQLLRNFASRHFDHYDLLLSLSSTMGGIGLEHQRSAETGLSEDYFTDPAAGAFERDLLPHEFTHSWNGKFRRPADLWSPDDHTIPERDSLLWVYEGQTQYWGEVLAARSGIMSQAQYRDLLAIEAADLDQNTPGRAWRSLQDTTNDPIISWHKPSSWKSWSRFGDYYPEGALLWLDADTLIREKSGGKKSLTDFARSFFGVDDGNWVTETYTFEDVVGALNAVQPYDWAGFLRARLDGHGLGAPLDGITRGGWKLTYSAEKSPLLKAIEAAEHISEFTYSLGLVLTADGDVASVRWNSPGFDAGLAKGAKILAVNGTAYSAEVLTTALTKSAKTKSALTLLVREEDLVREVSVHYTGGVRYPHLERDAAAADRLTDIIKPLP